MITFKFHYWTGDRDAGTITDDLICNEEMARARAVQELCEHYKILIQKTLRSPVNTDLDINSREYLNIPTIAMDGTFWITEISTSLTPAGCYDSFTVESYKDMEIPV